MPEREYKFVFCSSGCDIGDILQIVAVIAVLVAAVALVWAFNVHLNRDMARSRRVVIKRKVQSTREQQRHVAVEQQRYIDHRNWLTGQAKGLVLDDSSSGGVRSRRPASSVLTRRVSQASRLTTAKLSVEALERQRQLRIEQGRKHAMSRQLELGRRMESLSDRAYRKYLEQTTGDQRDSDGEESVKAMGHVNWPNMVGGGGG